MPGFMIQTAKLSIPGSTYCVMFFYHSLILKAMNVTTMDANLSVFLFLKGPEKVVKF